jgi:fibronectin type 3 domain-containing protein
VQAREYSATINIPNNDTSRNPAVFLVKATGFIAPPNAPEGVNASALSSSSIEISWNAVAGASSYRVYRSTTSAGTYAYVSDSSATSYTDSGLSANTAYYYKVSASNAAGEGEQSAVGYTLTLPSAPTGISVSALPSAIQITWNAVTGASSYKVYHSTDTTPPETPSYTGSGLSTTITGLVNETTYYVWVQAVNAGGGSVLSERVSGTPTNHFTANNLASFQSALSVINGDTSGGEYLITITGNFAATEISFADNGGKKITLEGRCI